MTTTSQDVPDMRQGARRTGEIGRAVVASHVAPTLAQVAAALEAIPRTASDVGAGAELDAVAGVVASLGLNKEDQLSVVTDWASKMDPPQGSSAAKDALAKAIVDRAVAASHA